MSIWMIFVGLLTFGALDIVTDVRKILHWDTCIKCILNTTYRNMQQANIYVNQLVMDIRRNTSGGLLWI